MCVWTVCGKTKGRDGGENCCGGVGGREKSWLLGGCGGGWGYCCFCFLKYKNQAEEECMKTGKEKIAKWGKCVQENGGLFGCAMVGEVCVVWKEVGGKKKGRRDGGGMGWGEE